MTDWEVLEFCEDNAISIKKFLKDNFDFVEIKSSKNKHQRHRIKHSEIASWNYIILVPLPFAHRYKELVLRGKLIIVKDDFGKYKAYINPRIILETIELVELNQALENYDLIPEEYLKDKSIENARRQIMERIADIEESLQLIKHFKGVDSLIYIKRVTGALNKDEEMNRTRKKVEK